MTRAIIQGRRTGVEVRKLRKDLRKKPLAAVAVNAEKTRVMSTSTDGSSPSRSACRGDRGNAHTRASILSAAPNRKAWVIVGPRTVKVFSLPAVEV